MTTLMSARRRTSILQQIARALGGEISGRSAVRAPGPGHSAGDRSLSVTLSTTAPDGFVVHSFSGDDWVVCRDYVRAKLGLPAFSPHRRTFDPKALLVAREIVPTHEPAPAPVPNTDYARRIWREAVDIRGSLAEVYLASSRLLILDPAEDWHRVLRFHPACPFGRDRAPAMVALLRDVLTDEPKCIQRTRLTQDGHKVDRQMLGPAKGAAIKVDRDDSVTTRLVIGEGLETVLTSRQIGRSRDAFDPACLRPAWALCGASGVGNFPVLPGIKTLSIHCERDSANERERQKCIDRWLDEGREVLEIKPKRGNDINDSLREVSRG